MCASERQTVGEEQRCEGTASVELRSTHMNISINYNKCINLIIIIIIIIIIITIKQRQADRKIHV